MQLYIQRVRSSMYYDVICNQLAATCRYDEIDTAIRAVMRPYLRRNISKTRVSCWQAPFVWGKL